MIDTLKRRNALIRAGVMPAQDEDLNNHVAELAKIDEKPATKEQLDLKLKSELASFELRLLGKLAPIMLLGIIAQRLLAPYPTVPTTPPTE